MRTYEVRDRRANHRRTYSVDVFESNQRQAELKAIDKVLGVCTAEREDLAIVGVEER